MACSVGPWSGARGPKLLGQQGPFDGHPNLPQLTAQAAWLTSPAWGGCLGWPSTEDCIWGYLREDSNEF